MRKINLSMQEQDSTGGCIALPAGEGEWNNRPTNGNSLSPALIHILQELQRELGFSNEDAGEDRQLYDSSQLESRINRVAERLGFELSNFERDQILAYVESEQKPFGILQDLVDDPQISDIIVTGYSKVTVQQGRRNLTTSVAFPSPAAYDAFLERLLKRAGTTLSTKKPLADGMIGSFARIHAVHSSLSDGGPYLTIRLNRFAKVSIDDLVVNGLAPKEIFNYLRGMIHCGKTVLVVGEVSTGKTTLVRALAASMPAEDSILVIEDTPEIKLEHPHVRYVRTREANTDGAGRVSPSECIRGGMRMAMNRIIFGEMRDAEAAEAFIDVCASGHPGLSTIHARSAAEAVTRLELFLGRAQKGVAPLVLRQQITTAVQVLVFVDLCRVTGRRRIVEVRELGAVADGVVRQTELFRYQVAGSVPQWRVCHRVSAWRDSLEKLDPPVALSGFPALLELRGGNLCRREGIWSSR